MTGRHLALTGATGFLGRYVIDSFRTAGWRISALTRRHQATEPGVRWVHGALDDTAALRDLVDGADLVIHAAGATKALTRKDFFRQNIEGTVAVMTAIDTAATRPGAFVFVSSLAAREPHLSHYSASKFLAEKAIGNWDTPVNRVIVRPPGIYGPGDMEILKLLKSSRVGFLPAPGSRHNRFSLIHAQDMADLLVCLGANPGTLCDPIEPDDGHPGGYTLADVATTVGQLTRQAPKVLPIPPLVLRPLGHINGALARVRRRPHIFTGVKARELVHADWVARHGGQHDPSGWQARITLRDGLSQTLDWYRQEGHL